MNVVIKLYVSETLESAYCIQSAWVLTAVITSKSLISKCPVLGSIRHSKSIIFVAHSVSLTHHLYCPVFNI